MSDTARKISKALPQLGDKLRSELDTMTTGPGDAVGFMLVIWTGDQINYLVAPNDRHSAKHRMLSIIRGWDAQCPDIPKHLLH